jgi:hypothetical protein
MNGQHINPSAVCRNPSRGRDEYGSQYGFGSHQNGKSVHNVSQVGVTDLGGDNSINNREISLSSINTSRCHAPTRTWRPRTREGVCDVFARRIRSALPVRQCDSLRQRLRTLAHVGERRVVWPTFPTRRPTQHVATRLRTSRLPLWQANRYFRKKNHKDWPVGTGPRMTTVCFACPTRNQHLTQKGNAMSDFTHPNSSPDKDRYPFWHAVVVPTARAIERLLWNLAWFGLFVMILFHCHA